jgi:hypothetical protein
MRHEVNALVSSAVICSLFAFAAPAHAAEGGTPVPDLSGLWARGFLNFEPPESGRGPITNRSRIPTGQSNLDQLVGDYTDPILKPEAAEILRKRGEIALTGKNFPDPSNQCAPHPMPYILWNWQLQLIQDKDKVTIVYMQNGEVRHVRLNGTHPAHVTPSWHGDSIGHYEGDTLVIDTVGVKVGPLSMLDSLGTPQSEAVHVVERYRLVDYETAIRAFGALEKEHIHIPPDLAIGDGVGIDPDYRGKGLQLQFTVEDPNVLRMPYSAASTFLRGLGGWVERICAENTREYYDNIDTAIPRNETPDF